MKMKKEGGVPLAHPPSPPPPLDPPMTPITFYNHPFVVDKI